MSPKKQILGVMPKGKEVWVFYRDRKTQQAGIKIAKNKKGLQFSSTGDELRFKFFLGLTKKPDITDIFTISKARGQFRLLYKTKNKYKQNRIFGALSKDGIVWEKIDPSWNIKEQAFFAPLNPFGKTWILLYGERTIKAALLPDLKKPVTILKPREDHFDSASLKIGSAFLLKEGVFVLYVAKNSEKKISLGAALLNPKDFSRVIWRTHEPLWQVPKHWNNRSVRFIGAIKKQGKLLTYWQHKADLFVVTIPKTWFCPRCSELIKKPLKPELKLKKHPGNPILHPRPQNNWESNDTFNPAAIGLSDGNIYLLYRAIGRDGISVLGYAATTDGVTIKERLDEPIYTPRQSFESNRQSKVTFTYPYMSGGGWGGCEDPRAVEIEDKIFMTYVAFNGTHPPGVALTSIKKTDFLKKSWNWEKPRLISKPGEIQKNWMIFPERIKGKYAILHSISPKIMIKYVNDLNDPNLIIESFHNNQADENRWDNIMRGAGSPPIKTDAGWLVLYHAMDRRDPNRYKVGAMLLDKNNPEKILHKSACPILEPEEPYENHGAKFGVVYVCGAVIKDKDLLVYYGGADRYVCVASVPLKKFLKALVDSSKPLKMQKIKIS